MSKFHQHQAEIAREIIETSEALWGIVERHMNAERNPRNDEGAILALCRDIFSNMMLLEYMEPAHVSTALAAIVKEWEA